MASWLPAYQYSLRSLLIAMSFPAIALLSWRYFGPKGAAAWLAFVGVVLVNLLLSGVGTNLGTPLLSGILGGVLLWSMVDVTLGILDGGLYRLEQSLMFVVVGLCAGLTSGFVTTLTRPCNCRPCRRGALYCGSLFVMFIAVFGIGRLIAIERLLNPEFNSVISYLGREQVLVLEFWGNGVDDRFLASRLADISTNTTLTVYFQYTRVTDAGIAELAGFDNLTRADLRGTLVTARGEGWLRRRLPTCEILR